MRKLVTAAVAGATALALTAVATPAATAAPAGHTKYLVTYGWVRGNGLPAVSYSVFNHKAVAVDQFREGARYFVSHPGWVHDIYLVRIHDGNPASLRHITYGR